jgi:hydrogenase expression/formation protein HypD
MTSAMGEPWTVMEVCGGQTHAILRWGLDQLLPDGMQLVHGPGCPVCVTPAACIDQALQLALQEPVILCSYGDMLRVPGSTGAQGCGDLLQARAAGGDVRLITSPWQALELARQHPERQVVLLAVGFETTAPATALLVLQACRLGVRNLTLLQAHVRVVPAMEAVLAAAGNRVQGFLAAGHVAAVMGGAELEQLVQRWRIPVVISGFEPQELLAALELCKQLLTTGTPRLLNAYGRVVRPAGNGTAQALVSQVFAAADGPWRGLGAISAGVLRLRPAYRHLDAARRFGLDAPTVAKPSAVEAGVDPSAPCQAAAVLQGRCRPSDCPSFGTACTPQHPLGAPMVSSEGACAAYHRYRR